jgi:hypothetical protein
MDGRLTLLEKAEEDHFYFAEGKCNEPARVHRNR